MRFSLQFHVITAHIAWDNVMCKCIVTNQAMQAAVDHQLTSLAASDPTKRVVIVTFSDEVSAYCIG